VGQALSLNGTTQYATVADANHLDLTSGLTMAAWINPAAAATQNLIKKANTSGTVANGYELSLASPTSPAGQKVFVRFNQAASGDVFRINSTSTYPTNGTWMHVAATYDGTTTKLYINGVMEGSAPGPAAIATNNLVLALGAQSDGASKYTGLLDDVHLYSRALSATEISALAAPNAAPVAVNDSYTTPEGTPLTVAAPGVLANDSDADGNPLSAALVSNVTHGTLSLNANGGFSYTPTAGYSGADSFTYRASDGSLNSNTATVSLSVAAALRGEWLLDGNASDSSSYGANATLLGSPPFVAGRVGQALSLNGTTQYATVADANHLDLTSGLTMAAWIRPAGAAPATQDLIKKATLGGVDGYELSLSSAGTVFVRLNQAASADTFRVNSTTAYPLSNSAWMHVAATYDGTTIRLYINGTLESSVGGPAAIATNSLPLTLGAQSDASRFYSGLLDDVHLYSRALSAAEITALATPAGGNDAPAVPTVNAPANGATGIGASPTLDVGVSDPNNDPLTVTFFGRPRASGNFVQIAQNVGVTSASTTTTWPGRAAGQDFEWYATVSDGTDTTTGPTWTFHTTPSADPVFVGAGDIGSCDITTDTATGELIDGIDGAIFTTGDNVYPNGTIADFTNCYATTPWGDTSVKSRTRPVPGNHDWGTGVTNNLDGYVAYYGSAATDAGGKSYYSYDIAGGNWHVINLDSECQLVPGGCSAGSPQELWLKADLAANSTENVIAIWHKPRYSSGATDYDAVQPLWADLYAAGADIVLDGHDHIYERTAPMKSGAALADPPIADPTFGIRQFTVGTGGEGHHGLATPLPTSEVRNDTTFGVLKLTLHATTYDWAFLPIAGSSFSDSGTGTVHGSPNAAPTATVSLNSASPKTNDTLTATATKADPNGDPVTLTYVWKVNGTTRQTTSASTSLTDTFNLGLAGNGDRGDTITVTVTPRDGTANGTSAIDTAVVANTAPVIDSAVITPTAPLTTDVLSVTVTSHDVDGDSRTYSYQWTKNDSDLAGATSATLDLGTVSAAAGDQFAVRVTASDGSLSSGALTAANVTVRAIAFRSAMTGQTVGGTTLSLARPAGVTTGDVLVASIDILGTATIIPPPGWTIVRSDLTGTTMRQQVYVRVADSESGPYVWAFSNSSTGAGAIGAYRGVDTVQLLDVAGGQGNPSSSAIAAPSVTTRVTNTQLISVSGIAANASISPPAGLSERAEALAGSGKTRVAVEIADVARPNVGATGTRTATATKAGLNVGQVIALRPQDAPAAEPTEPTAPQNLVATTTQSAVNLAWAAPSSNGGSAITGYKIYRDSVVLDTVAASARSYADTTASPGVNYTYYVTATNAPGESPASNSVSAGIPGPASPPGAPTGLTATRASKPRTIQLRWVAPISNGGAAITGYQIFRGTTPGGEAVTPVANVGSVTSYKDTGLQSGTTYYYFVRAVNSAGAGGQSNEASASAK
jgi:hypothetical protein